MKALSALAQSVRASTTMAIDTQFKKMRAEGIDVIGFSVGEPDFPTPEHIKQAGIRAIKNDQTKYTPTPGTLALRQAVRKRLQEDWGAGLYHRGDCGQRGRQAHSLCGPEDPPEPRGRGHPPRALLGELLRAD